MRFLLGIVTVAAYPLSLASPMMVVSMIPVPAAKQR